MKKIIFSFSLLSFFLVILFAGCQQDINSPTESGLTKTTASSSSVDLNALQKRDHLPLQTFLELQSVKSATAKYRNINNAIADGYADINVFIPHMGYHYMKAEYLDSTFEVDKPELLVYSPHPVTGKMRLVAVEYAVPQALSPQAPEGFTGDLDVWDKNDDFGLWTLHAWIWYNNPDGVFSEYNPLIP